jgi:hypothetical protein
MICAPQRRQNRLRFSAGSRPGRRSPALPCRPPLTDEGGVSFLNEHLFVGAVGYVYDQLTADRGQPAALGSFKSFSEGAGPQIGYNFP